MTTRIVLKLSSFFMVRRTHSPSTFGPGAAAVAGNDAPDVGQSDAGALELARAVEPLKHSEELVGILHVEAGAVIANKDHDLILHGPVASDFNGGALAGAGVLHG